MQSRLVSLLHYPYRNPQLTCSVLHALSAIGDESALHAVGLLIQPGSGSPHVYHKGRFGTQLDLSLPAAMCDAAIRERTARRHQNAELLRACTEYICPRESLPRAAESNAYQAASELMRSVGHKAQP